MTSKSRIRGESIWVLRWIWVGALSDCLWERRVLNLSWNRSNREGMGCRARHEPKTKGNDRCSVSNDKDQNKKQKPSLFLRLFQNFRFNRDSPWGNQWTPPISETKAWLPGLQFGKSGLGISTLSVSSETLKIFAGEVWEVVSDLDLKIPLKLMILASLKTRSKAQTAMAAYSQLWFVSWCL